MTGRRTPKEAPMTEDRADRPSRAEAVTEERRKRLTNTSVDPTLRRFGLTEDDVDREKFEYHATVDDKIRLIELFREDWDFFTKDGAKAASKDAEGVLRYQSGNNLDGSAQYTYFLRKLKKYADEDRAAKLSKIDADEQARLTETPRDAPDKSYTPKR